MSDSAASRMATSPSATMSDAGQYADNYAEHFAGRICQPYTIENRQFLLREARVADVSAILALFDFIYNGKYPDTDLEHLADDLGDQSRHLCVVAELVPDRRIIGCMMIKMDSKHRIGKAGRGLVLPEYRKGGLAPAMLKLAIDYLCHETEVLDVVYATSRTVSAGPAKMCIDAGMMQMGVFPNAVQIENMEHLNLEVYFSPVALEKRRPPKALLPAFQSLYRLALHQLEGEASGTPIPSAELSDLPPSRRRVPLIMSELQADVSYRYHLYLQRGQLAHAFFPFHFPNAILSTEDGCTEVFVWYEGTGRRAAIVGYRSERKNIHELLRAVAEAMESYGAAYLELLVPANDPLAQQSAFAARFLPCAYFPAMSLAPDGRRDDYFILSRTFRLLDFSEVVISPLNARFLQVYMMGYYQLYIEPLLGPLVLQAGNEDE